MKILLALMVPAAGLIGYLGNRWIQRASFSERLDRSTKLVGLRKAMREEGITSKDIDDLEDEFSQRRAKRRAIEDRVEQELPEEEADILTPMTQVEMNVHARNRLEQADLVLDRISMEYRDLLPESAVAEFDRAMEAWSTFADAQAFVESTIAEGGSMQPMLHAGERERLTVQRAADLREQVEFRRSL